MPPRLFGVKGGKIVPETPLFGPYPENLPLQSGWYAYVIDKHGEFRVSRRHATSHASMVRREPVASAGRFRVSRMGRVAEVDCGASEYRIRFKKIDEAGINYTITSFVQHPALNTHPEAVFSFRLTSNEEAILDTEGRPVADKRPKLSVVDAEGIGAEVELAIPIIDFAAYRPESPPRRYGMHRDQTFIDLEEDGESEPISPEPRLAPGVPIHSGKLNFVIDSDGYLIIGGVGHQILSGCQRVAGAGHIHITTDGMVSRIDLNFSGHYRPTLTAEYARYVYRAIAGHPLLKLDTDCVFWGRKFEGMEKSSHIHQFSREDMTGEGSALERWISR